MKVYLAGPITGCTDDEAMDWRAKVADCVGRAGHTVLDPMDWADMRGREHQPGVPAQIVKEDKRAIRRADIFFCNALGGISVGTTMEILYAYQTDTPVILVTEQEPLSPWYQYHADVIHDSLPGAVNTLGYWLDLQGYKRISDAARGFRRSRGCVELDHGEGSEVWE